MQQTYFEDIEFEDDIPLPNRPANCQVSHLITCHGEIIKNPVGRGWSNTPLHEPIITETLFGVLEITALPRAHMSKVSFNSPPPSAAVVEQQAMLN